MTQDKSAETVEAGGRSFEETMALRERIWRRVNDARLGDFRRANSIRENAFRERELDLLYRDIWRRYVRECAVNGIRA